MRENQKIHQAIITEQSEFREHQGTEKWALFNEDGSPHTYQANPSIVTGSAIGTVGKTTTADEPAANTIITVKFTNGNSATSPTLAFNGGTARAMQLGGTASAAAKLVVAAGGVVMFFFDGTILHQIGTHT